MNSIKLFLLIFLAVFLKNSFSQSIDSTYLKQLKKMFTNEQMKKVTYKENHFVFTDSVGVEHIVDLLPDNQKSKIDLFFENNEKYQEYNEQHYKQKNDSLNSQRIKE